jgi:hypothetical protein
MAKRRSQHTSDEFGKQGSGLAGLDAPMIGAAASIFSDALTERESGETPQPPAISVRALVITFAVMFALGVVGLWLMTRPHPAPTPADYPPYRFSYSREGTGAISGTFASRGLGAFQLGSETPPVDGKSRPMRPPQIGYDSSTRFLVNGRPLTLAASGDGTLTVYDVNGWPATISYLRVAGSEYPYATRVEFNVTESKVTEALQGR